MDSFDLLVIGGGINGCGIARDAAGRGLKVLLVEQDDLASHTSSASTKLIHGGLRYLEYYELRLVRESLIERERLLRLAPHLIYPMRFVMPLPERGRPAWMIRLGLFLYDHIGGRMTLPGSQGVSLAGPYGAGLKGDGKGFVYSDCWVDDARLVVLNAIGAREKGAVIRTRTKLGAARRDGDAWAAMIEAEGARSEVRAGTIVNAAGPWVGTVLGEVAGAEAERPPRLVKGSHIIVPRALPGEHAFILQNPDGRIVFAIPYERDFTLIGTTDVAWTGDPSAPRISDEEVAYLCESVNRYLETPVAPSDVVRSYSGVRPLFDDGRADAASVTRDYVLKLGTKSGPQILSVFGGKITTYRKLAEHALAKIKPFVWPMKPAWTDRTPLPGGDLPGGDFAAFLASVRARWPFLGDFTALRMARAYGTMIETVIGDGDMGEDFGAGLTAREVDYLVAHEWARTAEDILWRRTKIGMHTGDETAKRLRAYLGEG